MSKTSLIPKLKTRWVILAIAVLSTTGFASFTNADILWIFKAYGLILTCQVSFAIFFLYQHFQQRRTHSKAR